MLPSLAVSGRARAAAGRLRQADTAANQKQQQQQELLLLQQQHTARHLRLGGKTRVRLQGARGQEAFQGAFFRPSRAIVSFYARGIRPSVLRQGTAEPDHCGLEAMHRRGPSRGPSPGAPRRSRSLSRQLTADMTEGESNTGRESDVWSVSTAPETSSASEGGMDLEAAARALQEKTLEATKQQQQRLREKARSELQLARLKTLCQQLEAKEKQAALQLQDKENVILKLQAQLKAAQQRAAEASAAAAAAGGGPSFQQQQGHLVLLSSPGVSPRHSVAPGVKPQLADMAASCRRLAEAAAGGDPDASLEPASQLRLELEEKLVAMRSIKDVALPALSEWLKLNLAAWKALQTPLKGIVLPEKATGKVVQQIREKFEGEKVFVFKSLRALQHETLRFVRQICETPWKFEELRKEKEDAAAAAAAAAAQQAATAEAAEAAAAAAAAKQAETEAEGKLLASEVRRLQEELAETQEALTAAQRGREKAEEKLPSLRAEIERLASYAEAKKEEVHQLRDDNNALARALAAAKERLAAVASTPDTREIAALLKQQEETVQRALLSRPSSRFIIRRRHNKSSKSSKLLKALRSKRVQHQASQAADSASDTSSSTSNNSSNSSSSSSSSSSNAHGKHRKQRSKQQEQHNQQSVQHMVLSPQQQQQRQQHEQEQQEEMPTDRSVSVSSEFLSAVESLLASASEGLKRIELLRQQAAAEPAAAEGGAAAGQETPYHLHCLEETLQTIQQQLQQQQLQQQQLQQQQLQLQDYVTPQQGTVSVSDHSEIEKVEARLREASLMLAEAEASLQLPPNSQRLFGSLRLETEGLCMQLQQAIREKQAAQTEVTALRQRVGELETALSHVQQQTQQLQQQQAAATQLRVSLPASAGGDRALLQAKETEMQLQKMAFENELHKEKVAHAEAVLQLELAHEAQLDALESKHKVEIAELRVDAEKAVRDLEAELNQLQDHKLKRSNRANAQTTEGLLLPSSEALHAEVKSLRAAVQQQQREHELAVRSLQQRFAAEEEGLQHNKAVERLRLSHALEIQALRDRQRIEEKRQQTLGKDRQQAETAEVERALEEAIFNHQKEMHLQQLQHANELRQQAASHESSLCELRVKFERELLEQQRSAAAEAAAAAAAAEETLQAAADSFASRLKEAEKCFHERLEDANAHAARERDALIQTHKERVDRLNARLAEMEKKQQQQQQQLQQQIYLLNRETEELQRQQREQQHETEAARRERDMEIEKRESLAQQLFLLQQKAANQTADKACQAAPPTEAAACQVDPLVLQYIQDSQQQQDGVKGHTYASVAIGSDGEQQAGDSASLQPLRSFKQQQTHQQQQQKEEQQEEDEEGALLREADAEQQQSDLALRVKSIAERAHAKPYAFQRAAAAAAAAAAKSNPPAAAAPSPAGPNSSAAAPSSSNFASRPTDLFLRRSSSSSSNNNVGSSLTGKSSSSVQQTVAPLPLFRLPETDHQRSLPGSALSSVLSSSRFYPSAATAATATAATATAATPTAATPTAATPTATAAATAAACEAPPSSFSVLFRGPTFLSATRLPLRASPSNCSDIQTVRPNKSSSSSSCCCCCCCSGTFLECSFHVVAGGSP
ncbi:hypothetical protein Efla_003030 [Eimeria flavescens]